MIALSPQRADPDAWDKLSLDGRDFAGVARVKFERARDLQDKKVPGEHGEDLDDKGTRSGKIEITIRVWHVDDYKTNEAHLKEIDPTPGKAKAKVIPIVHAVTASRNVGYCVIESIEGPNDEEDGFTTWKIKARERLKPNTNNVGLGPPAGQTCDQMRHDYSILRDDYMTAKYSGQLRVADLRNRQRSDPFNWPLYEAQIAEVNQLVQQKYYYLELLRQKMSLKGCPNTPPSVVGL